ncbi:MAG: class I SAM-dependent methyltransferase [Gemmatimonadota bacterium]|nr:class I SAM-dependent methyltransferase [Gemmatimonadota bacterium]
MPHESTPTEGSDGRIANAYDRWSGQYDRDANATRDLDGEVLRRASLRLRGRDVLEIGCGTGKNTAWLAAEASSVIAMDFSEGMLARARTRVTAANVRFVTHDVRTTWPVADGSVDVVACNLVLEHVRALSPIFAEVFRALRAGGQFFLSELHPFRQLLGGRARFTDEISGEATLVPAFTHSMSEFVNDALANGLELPALGEWTERGAPAEAPPRLLTLLFART